MTSRSRARARNVALGTACLLSLGPAGSVAAARDELTLYSRSNLRGDRRTFADGVRDLDRYEWRDRAASIRVEGDAWELCRETDYRDCTAFAPGEYELDDTRFEGRLRSIRPLRGDGEEETYTRAQARYISQRLYRAFLDRKVDEESIRAVVDEVQAGRLRAQIDSIVRSPEFRSQSAPLGADALLDQIYEGLLGRPVDPGGTRTYLKRIERREYAAVVIAIIESREFRNRLPH
jgi:hypothetical protein